MTATEELKKAIELVERAADILQKSQMAFDFSMGTPHHVAYTRTNASGTVSNVQAKGTPKTAITAGEAVAKEKRRLADNANDATYETEKNPKDWTLHRAATDAHREAADAFPKGHPANKFHTKMADHHSELAYKGEVEEDKHQALIDGVHKVGNDLLNNPMLAEHHDSIKRKLEGLKNTPTAKAAAQVAGDMQLIAKKAKPDKPAGMDSKQAAKHLQKLADHPSSGLARKIEEWSEAHNGKDIHPTHIAGTEARHYSMQQVYSKNHATPNDDFSTEFSKTQAQHGHDAFILNHSNGHQYLVDTQGYSYARYVGHIKKG